jgi:hypothetical protein
MTTINEPIIGYFNLKSYIITIEILDWNEIDKSHVIIPEYATYKSQSYKIKSIKHVDGKIFEEINFNYSFEGYRRISYKIDNHYTKKQWFYLHP